jgi:hypothetical protein
MGRAGLALLLLSAGPVFGYKPAPPVRHDVFSPNGAFVLDVDPEGKRLTVYAAADRATPLWSFDREVWQESHFLSDDGQVVGLVTWRFVQVDELADGVCVEFWNRTGRFRQYTFAELCPHAGNIGFEAGPVGDFWRKWYSAVDADGTTLWVRTTDEFEFTFALDDGRMIKRSRVGQPEWAWWLLLVLVLAAGTGGIMLFVSRRRRAKRRLLARSGA